MGEGEEGLLSTEECTVGTWVGATVGSREGEEGWGPEGAHGLPVLHRLHVLRPKLDGRAALRGAPVLHGRDAVLPPGPDGGARDEPSGGRRRACVEDGRALGRRLWVRVGDEVGGLHAVVLT